MTTIVATKDGIWADSMETDEDSISSKTSKKIYRVNGWIVATAGKSICTPLYIKWAESGFKAAPPTELSEDPEEFTAVFLSEKTGELWYCEGAVRMRVKPPVVIGSGATYALAALKTMKKLGVFSDPAIAVKIACELDTKSGGRLQKVLRKKVPAPPRTDAGAEA